MTPYPQPVPLSPALNGSGRWDGVTSGGSYMGGVVTWVETDASKNGVDGDAPDTRTVHEFVWSARAVTKNTTHDTDTGSGADTLWETWYTHDALGNLTLAEIDDGRPRDVTFTVDAEGRVLQRDEADGNTATGDPRELRYYFAGRRVGDISNDGTANTDYVTGIASRAAAGGTGPFRGGGTTSVAYADFDQGYDAINGSHAPTATRYTVQAGDTLAGIAQAMWGDACLWYRLAEANGLSPAAPLAAGVQLTIPSGVTRTRHAADTFRPYDPNSAIGDLNPAAASPAGKGNKCGTFGAIISTVVAVALTSLLGPVPGNILSQAFNNLIGTQRGFSFKSLAIAAISAGITGGLEGVNVLGSQAGAFANDVVRGALANGLTQGVSVATGLQSKFDFAGVAAAGVVSGVGGAVSRAMVGKWERNAAGIVDKVRSTWNQAHGLGNQLVSGMASGIAGGATRSLATGTSFGDNVMAVLPDVVASTLGRAIAGEIRGDYRVAAQRGSRELASEAELHEIMHGEASSVAATTSTASPARLAYDTAGLLDDDLVTFDGRRTRDIALANLASAEIGRIRAARSLTGSAVSAQAGPSTSRTYVEAWGSKNGDPIFPRMRIDPTATLSGFINDIMFVSGDSLQQNHLGDMLVGRGLVPASIEGIQSTIGLLVAQTLNNDQHLKLNILAVTKMAASEGTGWLYSRVRDGLINEQMRRYGEYGALADRRIDEAELPFKVVFSAWAGAALPAASLPALAGRAALAGGPATQIALPQMQGYVGLATLGAAGFDLALPEIEGDIVVADTPLPRPSPTPTPSPTPPPLLVPDFIPETRDEYERQIVNSGRGTKTGAQMQNEIWAHRRRTGGVAAENIVVRLTKADFPEIATQVTQKQLRHIGGRAEYRGGGYLDSLDDAQGVLNAYHGETATILGRTSNGGFPVVRVEGITGTNVNLGAGFAKQPTNVFIIKGTAKPSIVPTNPNWRP